MGPSEFTASQRALLTGSSVAMTAGTSHSTQLCIPGQGYQLKTSDGKTATMDHRFSAGRVHERACLGTGFTVP